MLPHKITHFLRRQYARGLAIILALGPLLAEGQIESATRLTLHPSPLRESGLRYPSRSGLGYRSLPL